MRNICAISITHAFQLRHITCSLCLLSVLLPSAPPSNRPLAPPLPAMSRLEAAETVLSSVCV